MAVINDVLGTAAALEPPMRDIEGIVTEVRVRGIGIGHLLNMIQDPAGIALKDALEAASGKSIKITTPHIG